MSEASVAAPLPHSNVPWGERGFRALFFLLLFLLSSLVSRRPQWKSIVRATSRTWWATTRACRAWRLSAGCVLLLFGHRLSSHQPPPGGQSAQHYHLRSPRHRQDHQHSVSGQRAARAGLWAVVRFLARRRRDLHRHVTKRCGSYSWGEGGAATGSCSCPSAPGASAGLGGRVVS